MKRMRTSIDVLSADLGERELFIQSKSYGKVPVNFLRYKETYKYYTQNRVIAEEVRYSDTVEFFLEQKDIPAAFPQETGEVFDIVLKHPTSPYETIHIQKAVYDKISRHIVLFVQDEDAYIGFSPSPNSKTHFASQQDTEAPFSDKVENVAGF